MGKLPGWFDGLLGATQGAHVPAAPSTDQPGKGHPTIRSVLLEDFPVCKGGSEHQGQLFPRTLASCCTPGGCDSHLLPIGQPAPPTRQWAGGLDWTGPGQAWLAPRLGFPPDAVKRVLFEIQEEKLPLGHFSRQWGKKKRQQSSSDVNAELTSASPGLPAPPRPTEVLRAGPLFP